MYWDEERGVWATRWEMVECRLIEDIVGPSGVMHPTKAKAYVLGKDGHDTGETITIENRDPSLSFDISESTHEDHIYCIALRIGGGWSPIYIGCENAPDSSHAGRGSVGVSPRSIIEEASQPPGASSP